MSTPLPPHNITPILKRVSFLKPLSDPQVKALAERAQVRSYPANSRLILEGTFGHTFFIVVEGEVEAYKRRRNEKVVLVREGAGSIWGEMALMDSGLRAATVETVRRTTVIEIKKPVFDELLNQNPAISTYVIQEMNRRLRRTDSRMVEDLLAANADLLAAKQQLEETYDATLAALSAALDLRDSETEGHALRVTEYTMALGESLGLKEEALKSLHRGALLHDIGKIGIPDAILLKPGRLGREERTLISRHPIWGSNLLRDIHFLADAIPVVRHHHEWWDGTGYPDGLRGEQIPLFARIFAIADTFDALTSKRPYRHANNAREALEIMAGETGTHLDPLLFAHFESIFDSIIAPICVLFQRDSRWKGEEETLRLLFLDR